MLVDCECCYFIFFFKQKTAYEMRISDWSSDVCSSDLFADRFDGFSIGSNDLTQLVLGVDRDSAELANLFDEQNPAVMWMIRNVKIGRASCRERVCQYV